MCDILTTLASDVRKETANNGTKAKYRSIRGAFSNFDYGATKEGTDWYIPYVIIF